MNTITKSLFIVSACMVVASCKVTSYTVSLPDGGKTRIEAVTDNIVRVTKVPAGADFTDGKSLSVIADMNAAPAMAKKKGKDGSVTLTLAGITAIMNAEGQVTFLNPKGEVLTSEDKTSFAPYEIDGDSGWTVRQTFDSPEDEGFFGLGQHQADEWNYKGLNEELYQYNTKISIPFVVSTRKYGLLWDSYCLVRWGDPRDYAQIGDVFTLYDKDGVEGGLTGTYTPAKGAKLVRTETALSQEFLETPACDKVRTAPAFNFNGSNVLYEGYIEPSETGTFRFYLYYAGYMKVFIDGRPVTDEIWRTAWNPNGRKFTADLTARVKTPIRIEWKPDGEVSYCGLRVLSPVAEEEQSRMSWWGEMQDQVDYYVISAEDIDGVISGYRTLTGKAQIMPKWALGYWQSRERYSSSDDILSTLKGMRDRGIPVDNIVQDWQYWEDDAWGSHEFDPKRYPDPKGMVDSIHALNGRFMVSVWPKFYRYTEHFNEMDANGWIYQRAIVDSVVDWLGHEQSFYDAYSEGARKLFWQQMKDHLYTLGVDAWWMDASEPNIHDCTDMDYRKALSGPTALGSSTRYFNAYALMNAQAIYEGQRSTDPDTRVFLLTRNGFSGLQRYSTASWSGDIGTRWEDMKAQISAGLNYSISGIPFWGQDIGGFSVENRYMEAARLYESTGIVNADMKEWRELQARWHEWGVFCPLYRAHGQWPFREFYYIAPEGDPAYEAILAVDRLRYSLMPYIYTMAADVHFKDYTIMRPLMMDYTDDPVAVNTSDEFMFGGAFLVCPVYAYGVRERSVYLPEGLWYSWYEGGSAIPGGRTLTAAAPYEHIPVYVKAGSIVAVGPDIQYTAQDDGSVVTLKIYAGANGATHLYEDEGINYNYESGTCSSIPLGWDDDTSTLTLGTRNGSWTGMAVSKHVDVELYRTDGSVSTASLEYTGGAQSVTL